MYDRFFLSGGINNTPTLKDSRNEGYLLYVSTRFTRVEVNTRTTVGYVRQDVVGVLLLS